MIKTKPPVKKNNAHLIPKDKLVLNAYNLGQVLLYNHPVATRLPIKLY